MSETDFAPLDGDEHPDRAMRKNLMLAAQLEAPDGACAVRIRNLSASGAMIDGAGSPPVGSRFVMRRLGVEVAAEVVRHDGDRCALHFDKPVEIDEWVAGAYRQGAGGFAQARVDQVQQALRSGLASVAQVAPPTTPPTQSAIYARQTNELIAQELMLVKHMLDAISSELSDNIEILMKHERALQNCDIASAILEQVSKVVNAPDRASAIAKVNMHEVKARLSGQPTLT